jgi:hypothetical protein
MAVMARRRTLTLAAIGTAAGLFSGLFVATRPVRRGLREQAGS